MFKSLRDMSFPEVVQIQMLKILCVCVCACCMCVHVCVYAHVSMCACLCMYVYGSFLPLSLFFHPLNSHSELFKTCLAMVSSASPSRFPFNSFLHRVEEA